MAEECGVGSRDFKASPNCRMNKEILELAAHNQNIVGELLMVKVSRVRAEILKSVQETICNCMSVDMIVGSIFSIVFHSATCDIQ